jgi:hypothetical protein
VDFFIALLTGQVAVIVGTAVALGTAHADRTLLLITIVILASLIPLRYRSAVAATDEWAAVVRARVNVGRKPLAESSALCSPPN